MRPDRVDPAPAAPRLLAATAAGFCAFAFSPVMTEFWAPAFLVYVNLLPLVAGVALGVFAAAASWALRGSWWSAGVTVPWWLGVALFWVPNSESDSAALDLILIAVEGIAVAVAVIGVSRLLLASHSRRES